MIKAAIVICMLSAFDCGLALPRATNNLTYNRHNATVPQRGQSNVAYQATPRYAQNNLYNQSYNHGSFPQNTQKYGNNHPTQYAQNNLYNQSYDHGSFAQNSQKFGANNPQYTTPQYHPNNPYNQSYGQGRYPQNSQQYGNNHPTPQYRPNNYYNQTYGQGNYPQNSQQFANNRPTPQYPQGYGQGNYPQHPQHPTPQYPQNNPYNQTYSHGNHPENPQQFGNNHQTPQYPQNNPYNQTYVPGNHTQNSGSTHLYPILMNNGNHQNTQLSYETHNPDNKQGVYPHLANLSPINNGPVAPSAPLQQSQNRQPNDQANLSYGPGYYTGNNQG